MPLNVPVPPVAVTVTVVLPPLQAIVPAEAVTEIADGSVMVIAAPTGVSALHPASATVTE